MCLLEQPARDGSIPSTAFRENPIVPMRMEIEHHEARAPAHGGEVVQADGTPLPIDPEKGFGKAHFDQEMHGEGWIDVDGERFDVRGQGARDKTWGPRYWQSIDWYRWMHFHAGDDVQMAATVMNDERGTRISGLAFDATSVEEFDSGEIDIEWDDDCYHRSFRFETHFRGRNFQIEGRVRALIPLRNRRERPDGSFLHTRISEALTDYTVNGSACIGMSEFLDQIVDGRPSGMR